MIRVLESLRLSSERKLEIVKEIKEGSQPSGSFYTLSRSVRSRKPSFSKASRVFPETLNGG